MDEKLRVRITGNFADAVGSNPARGSVEDLAVTQDAARMVVFGNFTHAGGLRRRQVAMIQLPSSGPASVTGWATKRFDPGCSKKSGSYVRAVRFSPDGSYFVVATTGGYPGDRLCDTVSRWSTAARRPALNPTWIAYTGSDTLLSLAVTEGAVYVGGHQRWFNNPLARRKGPGAVPRPGLAALSPRKRGAVGVEPRTQPTWLRHHRDARHRDRVVDRQRHEHHRIAQADHLHTQEARLLPVGGWHGDASRAQGDAAR